LSSARRCSVTVLNGILGEAGSLEALQYNSSMRGLVIGLLLAVSTSCGVEKAALRQGDSPPDRAQTIFIDVAEKTGLDFVHFNGMSGELYMFEIFGPGAALFDYDNDGDLDAYLVQGNMLGPGKDESDATVPPPGPLPLTDRLYRNDLTVRPDGTRDVRFTDVTGQSGLRATGYGMGVAAGDYDNDGWTDLYVTNWGANQMLRNGGDGTFTDVTELTRTSDGAWGTSAAFVDYDGDGWLDLYVANYLENDYRTHKVCKGPTGGSDYCGPKDHTGQADRLYRNLGDGTFEDVSEASGIGAVAGKGLGVVTADVDGDGRSDIYVANDGMENFLWRNRGDGTFRDEALLAGCALDGKGLPEAGMGVDAGDFDRDGDEDLFVTHLSGETNTLYVNEGGGTFEDRSAESNLGSPSWNDTGFGTSWFDYDNDGWLDVLVVNGAVRIRFVVARVHAGHPYPLDQVDRLFRNRGDGHFTDVSKSAGEALGLSYVSRGAVFGDVDNDGDTDVLIMNNNGPARLLSNEVGKVRRWLGLRLVGTAGRRDMLGTRVEAALRDGSSLWRRARTDGSFCSAQDPRTLFGLGESGDVAGVRVHWPDGTAEEWTDLEPGRYTTLAQGTGQGLGQP
jgi:hypothetical protein